MKTLSKIASVLVVALMAMLAVTSCSKKDNEPVDPTPTPTPSPSTQSDYYVDMVQVGWHNTFDFDEESVFESKNYKIEDTDESRAKVMKDFVTSEVIPAINQQFSEVQLDSIKSKCGRLIFTLHKRSTKTKTTFYYVVGVPVDSYCILIAYNGNDSVLDQYNSRILCALYAKNYKQGTTVTKEDISDVIKSVLTEAVTKGEITKEEIKTLAADKSSYFNFAFANNMSTSQWSAAIEYKEIKPSVD